MQAELVQERLSRHVQHLLKFGRNTYDPLQYNAVVANINRPLLINAGIACCPCGHKRSDFYLHLLIYAPSSSCGLYSIN